MENKEKGKTNDANEQLPGNPVYPAKDDIYAREKKEDFKEEDFAGNEKKSTDPLDNTLDVPGAELDDADEMIGEEDEENNYYSLGGDNHNDLDEDKGE